MNRFSNPTIRDKQQALREWMRGTTCRAVLSGIAGILLVLTVWKTSELSTRGYEMSDLERHIQALQSETERLDVRIADLRAMKNIEERLRQTDFVAVTEATYVSPVGTAVARR